MPQPLRAQCNLDFEGLTSLPEHAAALGEIVSISGLLEGGVAAILAILTGGNARITTAMFLAVNSADAQRAMLKAAAEQVLNADDLPYFTGMMDRFRVRYGERNKLVHNVWGTSSDHPGMAIWCPASSMVGAFRALADSNLPGGQERAFEVVHSVWRDCYTYTVKDLRDVAERLTAFSEELSEFSHRLTANHQGINALTIREPGRMLRAP